ncbi:MAG: hypothetical protein QXV32_03530 [Conexivisphaerales archaeon]
MAKEKMTTKDSRFIGIIEEERRGKGNAINEVLTRLQENDEIMALRPAYPSILPAGTVNDGAYLAGLAAARGYKVSSSPGAKVVI